MYYCKYACTTVLTELYLLQNGNTPLHYAIFGGPIDCLERLLSTPGIDVNIIKNMVSWCKKKLTIVPWEHIHVYVHYVLISGCVLEFCM